MRPRWFETLARWGARAVVAGLLLWAVAALAHLPLGRVPEEAWLRLDVRTGAGRFEVCRDRTPEELAALPQHMRQPRACEVLVLSYRLQVEVDGERVLARTLAPRGVRHNRPLVADEVLALAPGERRLRVRFAPEGGSEALPDEVRAVVPDLTFDERVAFTAGRITVLALDGAGWRLLGG
jgi:hypothetical protein